MERIKVFVLSEDHRRVEFSEGEIKTKQYVELKGVYTSVDELNKAVDDIILDEYTPIQNPTRFKEMDIPDDDDCCIKALYDSLIQSRDDIHCIYFDVTEFYLNE